MAATPFDPNNIAIGAGILFYAPIGALEPTDLATPWDPAWLMVGSTTDGHTFTYDMSVEHIMIAEENAPVRAEYSSITPTVEFVCAEFTARNLKLAMNGGTVVTGSTVATTTPPNTNVAPVPTMLGWQSPAGDERMVFRRCIQENAFAPKRSKAPNIAELAMKFVLLRPAASTPLAPIAPFIHICAVARA